MSRRRVAAIVGLIVLVAALTGYAITMSVLLFGHLQTPGVGL